MRARDLQVLEAIIRTRGDFGHRAHLELAWSYLRAHPREQAGDAMAAAIRHLARPHGAEQKYHDAITRAWLHFVAVHLQRWGADTFAHFSPATPTCLTAI